MTLGTIPQLNKIVRVSNWFLQRIWTTIWGSSCSSEKIWHILWTAKTWWFDCLIARLDSWLSYLVSVSCRKSLKHDGRPKDLGSSLDEASANTGDAHESSPRHLAHEEEVQVWSQLWNAAYTSPMSHQCLPACTVKSLLNKTIMQRIRNRPEYTSVSSYIL